MDYFVSMDGNDAASGDYNSPFATIQHGIDVADEGDTVFVFSGTYIENISSITGITQFSTWIQVHSAMFELVNKTLQLTVTFEKQIASTASS